MEESNRQSYRKKIVRYDIWNSATEKRAVPTPPLTILPQRRNGGTVVQYIRNPVHNYFDSCILPSIVIDRASVCWAILVTASDADEIEGWTDTEIDMMDTGSFGRLDQLGINRSRKVSDGPEVDKKGIKENLIGEGHAREDDQACIGMDLQKCRLLGGILA